MRKYAESNPFIMIEVPWYRGVWENIRNPRVPQNLLPNEWSVGVIIVTTILMAISQGIDYILRPEDASWSMTFIERALPLDFWGSLFIGIALLALFGIVCQVWPIATFAHGTLTILYLAFTVGVTVSVISDGRGWGWQTGTFYLGLAMFHSLAANGCYDEWASEWKEPPPSVIGKRDTDSEQSGNWLGLGRCLRYPNI